MNKDVENYGESGVDTVGTIVKNCGEIFRYWDEELEHDKEIYFEFLDVVLNPKSLLEYCVNKYGYNTKMKNKI